MLLRFFIFLISTFSFFFLIDLSLSMNRPSFFYLPKQLQVKLSVIVLFVSLLLFSLTEFLLPFFKIKLIKNLKSYYYFSTISNSGYSLEIKHESHLKVLVLMQPTVFKKDELVVEYTGNNSDTINFLTNNFNFVRTFSKGIVFFTKTIDFTKKTFIKKEIDKILSVRV